MPFENTNQSCLSWIPSINRKKNRCLCHYSFLSISLLHHSGPKPLILFVLCEQLLIISQMTPRQKQDDGLNDLHYQMNMEQIKLFDLMIEQEEVMFASKPPQQHQYKPPHKEHSLSLVKQQVIVKKPPKQARKQEIVDINQLLDSLDGITTVQAPLRDTYIIKGPNGAITQSKFKQICGL